MSKVTPWQKGLAEYRHAEDVLQQARDDWSKRKIDEGAVTAELQTELQQYADVVKQAETHVRENAFYSYYPANDRWIWKGEFNDYVNVKRENYAMHMQCIRATKDYAQTAFFAGNRIGKTLLGSFCTACHLTGIYPDWWDGHRFDRPIDCWVLVKTYELIVDPVQTMLFGRYMHGVDKYVTGTGTVPKSLVDMQSLQGAGGVHADALSTVRVRHVNSTSPENYSHLNFRSMKQGVGVFGSRALDWIWIDEGPPVDIYNECQTRILDRQGRILLTWTPLEGFEPVVEKFIPKGRTLQEISQEEKRVVEVTSKSAVVMAGWEDVPHIPPDVQQEEIKHLRETGVPEEIILAKVYGIPHVGEGKIYSMPREELQYFASDLGEIPSHWPRVFGMDVGHHVTAAVWAAVDLQSDRIYIYDEYYGRRKDVSQNASGIGGPERAWIPGVIDPSANQRSVIDGKRLLTEYRNTGLKLAIADNAVEAGIEKVRALMHTGKMRVASHLKNFWYEYNLYRREVKEGEVISKIVKRDDHLMDAMRYLIVSGIQKAKTRNQVAVQGNRFVGQIKLWRPGEG